MRRKIRIYRWRDLTGKTYGRLVVIRPNTESYRASWFCRCDCGKTKSVTASNLLSGHSRSCGCLSAELSAKRTFRHGLVGIPEYWIWAIMKARCNNKNHHHYRYYGGRGIKVCSRWEDSFKNFLSDMGKRPSPLHSINRKDNNKGYSPDNCHWATLKEQANNKSNNVVLEYSGQRMSVQQWSDRLSVPHNRIRNRIRRGWSVQRALTTGVK